MYWIILHTFFFDVIICDSILWFVQKAEIIGVDRLGFDVRATLGTELKTLRFSFNSRVCGKNYMLVILLSFLYLITQDAAGDTPHKTKSKQLLFLFSFYNTDPRYCDFESGKD